MRMVGLKVSVELWVSFARESAKASIREIRVVGPYPVLQKGADGEFNTTTDSGFKREADR